MTTSDDARLVVDQLCRFARAHLVANGTKFDEHSPLAGAGIDSFSLVELLVFAEGAFGVKVPDSHMTHENLASLSTLARCIVDLASSQGGPPRAIRAG